MKANLATDIIGAILGLLAFVAVFFPWMMFVLDFVWWFFTNHSTGIVEWNPLKVLVSIAYPFFAAGLVITLAS